MANNQEQVMAAFVQWLPKGIVKFKDQLPQEVVEPIANSQSPDEVVEVLNELSKSEQGKQVVQSLYQAFEKDNSATDTGMFKAGGKLSIGLRKFQEGGETGVIAYLRKNNPTVKEKQVVLNKRYPSFPDMGYRRTLANGATQIEIVRPGFIDATGYPRYHESSSITISPDKRDTTGYFIRDWGNNYQDDFYVTKKYKEEHPWRSLGKKVIPQRWLDNMKDAGLLDEDNKESNNK